MSDDDFRPGYPGAVFDPALKRRLPNLNDIPIDGIADGPRDAPDLDKIIGGLADGGRNGLGKWDLGIDGGGFGLKGFIDEWGLDGGSWYNEPEGGLFDDPRDAFDGGLSLVAADSKDPAPAPPPGPPPVPASAGTWRALLEMDEDGEVIDVQWAHFDRLGKRDTATLRRTGISRGRWYNPAASKAAWARRTLLIRWTSGLSANRRANCNAECAS